MIFIKTLNCKYKETNTPTQFKDCPCYEDDVQFLDDSRTSYRCKQGRYWAIENNISYSVSKLTPSEAQQLYLRQAGEHILCNLLKKEKVTVDPNSGLPIWFFYSQMSVVELMRMGMIQVISNQFYDGKESRDIPVGITRYLFEDLNDRNI